MQIKVWTGFSKRINSTKQPTGGTTVDVLLKEECDIKSPHFILASPMYTINYVQAFGNYYFADVKNIDGHRCEIMCTLDHLATFKSNISSYSGYVEYAASSSDVTITDPRNKPTSLIDASTTTFTMTSTYPWSTTGCYVLGVISTTATGDTGVLDYYSLTPGNMALFCALLNDQSIWSQIKNQFDNVMDSIVSCIWLPFSNVGGTNAILHIGDTAFSALGYVPRVTDRTITFNSGLTSINFSAFSGTSGSGMTYLEKAPFATGELYLPFIGNVELDMDILAFTKSMQISGWIDAVTGDIVYKIQYGAIPVSTYSGNLATKVPVAGASYDGIGVATGVITAIGGLAAASAAIVTGGSAIPAIATIGAGALHSAKSTMLHTMVNGNSSSAIGVNLGTSPVAVIYQNTPTYTTLTAPQTELGMPYFKTATLSSLSGYIKCSDASVAIVGDGNEQSVVNGYLNSGFYLE